MTEPSESSNVVPRELTGRIGKYEIKRPIGKGAMGQVYLAHDTVLDRDVALKVMAAQIADDPELKARFEREARTVAKMTHPNVVTVFDLGTHTDGSPYIAMELLKGRDLQKATRQPPPMSLERKVAVIVQVLTGLAYAHQQGVFHRDIKPANIFIVSDAMGSVKIMDFGVARLQNSQMTGTGNVVGTADYMSPEQVKGERVDGRSDLFSVGCMLFELITGRRPFHSDNLMAIFYKITHDGANFDLFPTGPEHDALLPILKKALARSIDERYQTAAEFAVDLREWLRTHATTASSQSVLESLVDLETPAHAPEALTEAPRGTVLAPQAGELHDATVDLSTGRRSRGAPGGEAPGPTRVSARTVADVGARPAVRPGRGVPSPRPRRPVRRAAPRRNPLPWIGLAAVATAAAAGLGYVAWRSQERAGVAQATPASPPPVTQPPPTTAPTPTPPPVTAAPQPTFAPPEGRAAASVRAASAAFDRGRYGEAVTSAQKALREDPSNTTAREILDKAENGQKAAARIRAGEAALARGNFAEAEAEARAARSLAPWDRAVVDLGRRIDLARLEAERAAGEKARQEQQARINQLLNQGASALAAKEYDAAIAAYDQVLQLEPGNAAAQTGRAGAVSARSVAEAAAGGAPSGGGAAAVHTFVASGSVARGSSSSSGGVPPGFEATPDVNVHQGSQAAALPGELVFEVSPAAPEPGQRYSITAFLVNNGSQPIQLERMIVTTTIDGDKQQGPVPPSVSVVAPGARAPVYQVRNRRWKGDTRSWSMEVVVYTSKRETYKNVLTWK
jgi:tetratricopeptide (TPR) repeat protein/tRNA A-37 threonylcarbamoyl transferase component Bud32